MSFFQVVYQFTDSDGDWSEVFYDESASIDDFQPPNSVELNNILHGRGTGTVLLNKVIIEEGGLRRAKPFVVNVPANHNGAVGPKDVSGVKAKCRLLFAGGGSRIWNCGGVADADIVPASSGPSIPSPAFAIWINQAIAWIKGTGNPYLGKRLKSISNIPWKDVVSFAADPTNGAWTRVTVSTLGAPLAAGTEVYFRGIDKFIFPYIRGTYRIVGESTTGHFSIPTEYREASATTSVRNVQFREAEYEYPAINAGSFKEFGTRKTAGGPFSRRRGRRSAQRAR